MVLLDLCDNVKLIALIQFQQFFSEKSAFKSRMIRVYGISKFVFFNWSYDYNMLCKGFLLKALSLLPLR